MVSDSINLAEINSKSPGNVCSDSEINHLFTWVLLGDRYSL